MLVLRGPGPGGARLHADRGLRPAPDPLRQQSVGSPEDFQDHIIRRYQDTGTLLLDANSGFEPKTFDEAVLRRWEAINRGPWRFAYDETAEGADVERVCRMLKGYRPGRKRVYVLIGNEPFQACMDRILQVIAWGCEPHVQPVMKLNALTRRPWVREELGWNEQLLRDVARWANRWLWRRIPFEAYKKRGAAVDSNVHTL